MSSQLQVRSSLLVRWGKSLSGQSIASMGCCQVHAWALRVPLCNDASNRLPAGNRLQPHSSMLLVTLMHCIFSLNFVSLFHQANKSFFSEIIASISDISFSKDGRYIVSRDYMTLKLWDLAKENAPVATYSVHEQLRARVSGWHCLAPSSAASKGQGHGCLVESHDAA